MRGYRLAADPDGPRLQRAALAEVSCKPGEVVVEIAAASLNYRDLLVAAQSPGLVPLSDGAGTIVESGDGVAPQRVGERVAIGFMPGWIEGAFSEARQASALGGAGVDGVLRARIAVPASAAVRIPDAMSFEEAACLPCAGVTAWAALFERRPLCPGETVLLLGTGGVSILALDLAKKAGARVIITSSSDDKLARAARLGADATINYARTPDWDAAVRDLTGGVGADLAIDVGGPATISRTLRAVRADGRISLMGVLTGFGGEVDTGLLLRKRITLQGIYVGPVASLALLARSGVRPVIDRVFGFDEAEEAYAALAAADHFGKLVIRVDSKERTA